MQPRTNQPPGLFSPANTLPFVLVTALFFLWAIPNNLNDVLIKQFMKSFEMSRFQAGLLQSAFYLGYFVLAAPAALIMRRYSYKTGLVIGLLLYSTGTFLFWPAAVAGHYGFFLCALFVIASGLAFLETGANPFIAVLGDPRTSERRLNFSQAFNPIGSICAALLGTTFIFSGVELSPAQVEALKLAGKYEAYLHEETMRVGPPYMILGAVVLVWAVLLMLTKFPKLAEEPLAGPSARGNRLSLKTGAPELLCLLVREDKTDTLRVEAFDSGKPVAVATVANLPPLLHISARARSESSALSVSTASVTTVTGLPVCNRPRAA